VQPRSPGRLYNILILQQRVCIVTTGLYTAVTNLIHCVNEPTIRYTLTLIEGLRSSGQFVRQSSYVDKNGRRNNDYEICGRNQMYPDLTHCAGIWSEL
jgi:hypothetical protein